MFTTDEIWESMAEDITPKRRRDLVPLTEDGKFYGYRIEQKATYSKGRQDRGILRKGKRYGPYRTKTDVALGLITAEQKKRKRNPTEKG